MLVTNRKTTGIIPGSIYIGRPSPLGNPFTHLRTRTLAETQVATVEAAIAAYRQWLYRMLANPGIQNDLVRDALRQLNTDSVLACWCKPNPCHGDVIDRAWHWATLEGLL